MESALVGLGGTTSIRGSSSRCSHLLTPTERHTSHLPTIPIGISRYVHSSSGDSIKEYGHPRRLGEREAAVLSTTTLHNNPEHGNLLPIFHQNAKYLASGAGVGQCPRRQNFALGIPTCWYLKCENLLYPTTNPRRQT